jgi:DNA-binding NtrC family response regulator
MSTLTQRETEILPLLHRHAVLCVDDEPAILAALRRSLSREPYDLLMTESPVHALRCVESRPISLVLSDQRMPAMSGIDMLHSIHESSPDTLGVILTGFPESMPPFKDFGGGVRWVLVKPWDHQTLIRTLRHLLRERELGESQSPEEDWRDSLDLGGES